MTRSDSRESGALLLYVCLDGFLRWLLLPNAQAEGRQSFERQERNPKRS